MRSSHSAPSTRHRADDNSIFWWDPWMRSFELWGPELELVLWRHIPGFLWDTETNEIPQTPNRIRTTFMRMFDSGGSNQLQWQVALRSWMISCQAWLTKGLNRLLVIVGRFWVSLASILLDSRQASQNSFLGSVFAEDEISRRNWLVLDRVSWGGVERIRLGQLCLFLDRWHGSPNHISKRQNHRGVFIRSIWIRFNCMSCGGRG